MSSSLIVEVCEVLDVQKHPEADRLNLVTVKGWQIVTATPMEFEDAPNWEKGDKCVYFPPDTLVPESWTNKWGITKYCSSAGMHDIVNPQGETETIPYRKIKSIRLRGQRSEGFMCPCSDIDFQIKLEVGTDVASYFNARKYEPPPRYQNVGGTPKLSNEPDWFHRYTSIENINNFTNVLQDGEEVVVTEKLHGTNARVGLELYREDFPLEFTYGSHRMVAFDGMYVHAFDRLPAVRELLAVLAKDQGRPIIFGEIFGDGVQDMRYGLKDKYEFRAFDLSLNGDYVGYDWFVDLCRSYGVPMVPELYRGPFSLEKIRSLTDGPTTLVDHPSKHTSKFHGREGVVVKPTVERRAHGARVIFKSVSVDYKSRKNAQDNE